MRFLSLVGNSFGCSASGERLVSAARDGDYQEAKALLDYNPRLARYSTFGVRNSPLHYSAAQGHHEIVSLLLESGVDINLRNYRGQTALMQACQYGHWEVVQTLVLFKANIHRADYLNGGTALHFAALNGHSRCIRILLADYIPSLPNFFDIINENRQIISELDQSALYNVINRPSDGGITAVHMASLNGHAESVQLLLDLGASLNNITIEDGTTIDLIGAGSTPLHYAACGGNAQCCQILVAKGASLTAQNANGWTPLMVARSWNREGLDEILSRLPENRAVLPLSSYLCLPLMSIVNIARECGWRSRDCIPTCVDPCVVCLERKCTVAAEGCSHEFCTRCALYLCSTNTSSTIARGSPGSVACPLCRHGIVSFVKLLTATPLPLTRTSSLSLSFCACSSSGQPTSLETLFCRPDHHCGRVNGSSTSSFRSLSCQRLTSMRLNSSSFCMGTSETDKRARGSRCFQSGYRRTMTHNEGKKSWLCSLNQCVATGSDY